MDLLAKFEKFWGDTYGRNTSETIPDLCQMTGKTQVCLQSVTISELSKISSENKLRINQLEKDLRHAKLLEDMLEGIMSNVCDSVQSESRSNSLKNKTGNENHISRTESSSSNSSQEHFQKKPIKSPRTSRPRKHPNYDPEGTKDTGMYDNKTSVKELSTSWLDRAVGSENICVSDEDEEENGHSNIPRHFNLPRFTNPDSINQFNILDEPAVASPQSPEDNIFTGNLKIKSDIPSAHEQDLSSNDTEMSVQEKIKAMERRASTKSDSVKRNNSDRPAVPPRPRLSKPKVPPHIPVQSSESLPPELPARCREGPKVAPSVARRWGRSFKENDSPPVSYRHSADETSCQRNEQEVSGKDEGYVCKGGQVASTCKNQDLENDSCINITKIQVGNAEYIQSKEVKNMNAYDDSTNLNSAFIDHDTGGRNMFCRQGFGAMDSTEDVHKIVGKHFRRLSAENQISDKEKSSFEIKDVDEGEYVVLNRRGDENKSTSVNKEKTAEETKLSTFSNRNKYSIFNTSINVLLTQHDGKMTMSDENSSDEESEKETQNSGKPLETNLDTTEDIGSDGSNQAQNIEDKCVGNWEKKPDAMRSTFSGKEQSEKTNQPVQKTNSLPVNPQFSEGGQRSAKDRGSVESLDSVVDSDDDVKGIFQSLEEDDALDEETQEKQRKLHLRKILLNGILESEKSYVSTLEYLVKFKRNLQMDQGKGFCSFEDITEIFYKVEEMYKCHDLFVKNLKEKVENLTDETEIGAIFKELTVYFPMYMEYVENSKRANSRIIKCCQENQEFEKIVHQMEIEFPDGEREKTRLEEILFKPVQRLQRNSLVLNDLLKVTPEDHKDFVILTKAQKLVEQNLKCFHLADYPKKAEEQRLLVKHGFVVEMVGSSRKLRYIFLFNDVIVCTKHKVSGRQKVTTFECKWFVPMSMFHLDIKGNKSFDCKEDIDAMKKKLVSLKAELRAATKGNAEPNRERPWSVAWRREQRLIEKKKKKIEEHEASLVLASPHLPLHVVCREDKVFTLLFSNDFEREEWRDAVDNLQRQPQHIIVQKHLSGQDIQTMVNECKQLPNGNNICNILMKLDEEMLSGFLNVTIHTLAGIDQANDQVYCQLELDSYGHFFLKAKTSCKCHNETAWDEDFEMDLEGSQTLRILCYRKLQGQEDELIGRSALELSSGWLTSKFKELKIPMNELTLTISVKHSTVTKTLTRMPSKMRGGIFGVSISKITNREKKLIPTIVTCCISEIENRGLTEVGIYRISGVTSDVQSLKKTFDKNLVGAQTVIKKSDIHAVTGLLKLFFRELPEPLFTDEYYKAFVDAVSLSDVDSKEKCLLQLLHNLPDPNYYTIVKVIEHLVHVASREVENKMSLSNLATVFGPTLLHPAVKENENLPPAVLIMKGAQDVFKQADVVSFFLKIVDSGKSIRRSSSNSM